MGRHQVFAAAGATDGYVVDPGPQPWWGVVVANEAVIRRPRESFAARVAAAGRAVAAAGAWFRRLPPLVVDLAIAIAFFVAMVIGRITAADDLGDRFLAALLLNVVVAGSLVWRRHYPVTSFLVNTAGLIVEAVFVGPGPLTPYANLIGLYSMGYYATRARAWLGPVLVLPGVFGYFAGRVDDVGLLAPITVTFSWMLAWAAGYGAARRKERNEATRRLMRREAIIAERVRIARELHDVVGHTVNAMLVQAGASRMVLDTDPERARELLASIERTGRDALTELDRVLGVLRADDDVQPGLAELDRRVVAPLVYGGLAVRVDIDPAARGLPRSLDLSTYRIVQEALTNAVKHGRAHTVEVTVRVADGSVRIRVHDDGRGPAPGYQPGRGLLGITERVAVFGGTVEHGRDADSGFTLRAELPLP
jgi:signal transduction histidine kinase